MTKSFQSERLAAVETEVKAMHIEIKEIRGDVKELLAFQNRQRGASRAWAALAAGLLTLGGAIGGAFAAKGH